MKIGIHAPTQGATQRFSDIASALQTEAVLWLWDEGPDDTRPGWINLVRLFTPEVREDAQRYAQRVAPIIGKWYASGKPAIFIPGNEVDGEGPWSTSDWEAFLPQYAAILRQQWINIVLACPAYTCGGMPVMSAALVAPFDAICAHCYFPQDQPTLMQDPAWGGAWQTAVNVAGNKPVWITEANCNPTDADTVTSWLKTLPSAVAGVTLFIADSADKWPEYNVTVAEASAIRSGISTAPQIRAANIPLPALVPSPPSPSVSPFAYDHTPESTYNAMVRDGSIPRTTSPFLTNAMYLAVDQVAQDQDISVRLLLAWTRSENNQATNISDSLLGIHNYAGIKYAMQPRAYRSNVYPPSNEKGVYAGFSTDEDFWATLAINIQTILPDDYAKGNLARIASMYTSGDPDAGAGADKVQFWQEYNDRTRFPGPGTTQSVGPTTAPGIAGQTIVDTAMTYLGMTSFNDEGQRVQTAGYCEEFVEVVNEQCGVPRNRRPTALEAGQFYGPLNMGRAPAGAAVYFDARAGSADGHVGIARGDSTMISSLATVRIDAYESWDSYIGWKFYPGVGGEYDMLPRDGAIDDGEIAIAWSAFNVPLNPSSAIYQEWKQKVYGKGIAVGVPTKPEQAFDQGARVIQPFSSGLVAQWTAADGNVLWLGTLP